MKTNAVIVDDELNARKALENMLTLYCPDIQLVGLAEDVASAHKLLKEKEPDLVFLDVRMPDGTGFDLLKKFRKINFKIIFVTAYDQYALHAIKLSAVDYLLKPVNPRELRTAVDKAVRQVETEEQLIKNLEVLEGNIDPNQKYKKIILNSSNQMYVIRLNQIIRLESDENYTIVHIEPDKKIMVSRTMKEFEELLALSGFCRTHNSHMINMEMVDHYDKGGSGQVVLINGEKVPLSSRRKDFFMKALR